MWQTGTAIAVFVAASGMVPDYARPPADEIAAVKQRFGPLQQLSFATGHEYCGYLGRDAHDRIQFTPIRRGHTNGCTPVNPDNSFAATASLHTHGAYSPSVPAEFPTVRDMLSDAREGVNGYIGTPGGRLWFIDGTAMIAVQLCGLGCLPRDPNFVAGDDGEIAQSYSLDDLRKLEADPL
jgi:hypothetical protein